MFFNKFSAFEGELKFILLFIVKNCGMFGGELDQWEKANKAAKGKQDSSATRLSLRSDLFMSELFWCLSMFVFFSGIIHKFKST